MAKINRREFIEKTLLCNGSIILGSGFGASVFSNYFLLPPAIEYHVPIQPSNPSLVWSQDKCKGCRECVIACTEIQKVHGSYKSVKNHHVCIHCGKCLMTCDKGAITEKFGWQDVLKAIDDPSKIVIASISPSVPAGIGDYFGMTAGSYLHSNIAGSCKALGFDYVLDTNFSADLTIMEEAHELQKRIEQKQKMPQFTSCCPAWVKYVEMFYPSLVNHLSSTRSPVIMQGAMVKTYFADKMKIDPSKIVHVAFTPCTAKKYEITRDELTTDGMRSTDFALTTNELALMLHSKKIDLAVMNGKYDSLMGNASGSAAIFGNTGGVMRAAIRTAHYNMTGKNPGVELISLKDVQGLKGMKEATVDIAGVSLNVAVCYEMRNAQVILEQVKKGTCKYDFVEVMSCQGGCIGGAGQPTKLTEVLENRIKALDTADASAGIRYCHENPEIKKIYKKFLGKPGGEKAEHYLHTSFTDKSSLLVAANAAVPAR
ncbi:MAG TPA: [FeFe] hydrogenase, group A [Bacteroidales bacterium]|nr:[FeFe] hydrogenase, group A [Bacteroidales bacterium]